jgi:hypothetical protein
MILENNNRYESIVINLQKKEAPVEELANPLGPRDHNT